MHLFSYITTRNIVIMGILVQGISNFLFNYIRKITSVCLFNFLNKYTSEGNSNIDYEKL